MAVYTTTKKEKKNRRTFQIPQVGNGTSGSVNPLRAWTVGPFDKEKVKSQYITGLLIAAGVISITEDLAWDIVTAQNENGDSEIQGLFALRDDRIVAIQKATHGIGSGVGQDGLDNAKLAEQMYLKSSCLPNGQWHTHPGLGAFWSGTDTNDQDDVLARNVKLADTGYTHFMVIDPFSSCIVRTVSWDKATMEIAFVDRQVKIIAHDKEILLPKNTTRSFHGTYGYGTNYNSPTVWIGDKVKIKIDDVETWLTVTGECPEKEYDYYGDDESGHGWKFAESLILERIKWNRVGKNDQFEYDTQEEVTGYYIGDVVRFVNEAGDEHSGYITQILNETNGNVSYCIHNSESGKIDTVLEENIRELLVDSWLEDDLWLY